VLPAAEVLPPELVLPVVLVEGDKPEDDFLVAAEEDPEPATAVGEATMEEDCEAETVAVPTLADESVPVEPLELPTSEANPTAGGLAWKTE